MQLIDQNILLGVTGSIAAYKSVELARSLTEEGANVHAVLTESACRFITPYMFETITGNPACSDLFKEPFSHINLPKEARLLIIAPATANTLNKLACGIADNLLSSIWLAYEGPVIMAPAMNFRMYRHPIVQKQIKALRKLGVQFAGPVTGVLACGEEGKGRMADVSVIHEAAVRSLSVQDLKGQHILVTAGPTREPIDPVRFISNRSSGKMGYAIAAAALRRGADVTLISGPSALRPPDGADFIKVESASAMERAVFDNLRKATAVIMTAAVSDYSSRKIAKVKLKKKDSLSLNLKINTDILKKLGQKKGKRLLVGFAAESGKNIEHAKEKMKKKNLDLIVFNDISQKGAGFDIDTNVITLIGAKGGMKEYPVMSKMDAAGVILDRTGELLKDRK